MNQKLLNIGKCPSQRTFVYIATPEEDGETLFVYIAFVYIATPVEDGETILPLFRDGHQCPWKVRQHLPRSHSP